MHPSTPLRQRVVGTLTAAVLGFALLVLWPTPAHAAGSVVVANGETYTVSATTVLDSLTVQSGGSVVAANGQRVTLTVNGVETGQAIATAGGTTATIQPGTYTGTVVLTPAAANDVTFQGLTFPFRQSLYVGSDGPELDKSVDATWLAGTGPGDTSVDSLKIRSTGEAFNGVYVAEGGSYTVSNPDISLQGNGRSDFTGYGAALAATGSGTRLVVDGATVDNSGNVRMGVFSDAGANVVVKNSEIHTADGTLPSDYVSNVGLGYMRDAPWMLGITGNVRTTNLMGTSSKAAYVDSELSSTGWGVLSTDSGTNTQLTSINSDVSTGTSGYGAYAIGNSSQEFLGTAFDVDDYGIILTSNGSGTVHFGDSSAAAVAALNTARSIGLTSSELAALPERSTTVSSERIGAMWHGAGNIAIDGGTVFDTTGPVFEDKGKSTKAVITVDGSDGARLRSDDRVILQVMENDDPGPVVSGGVPYNTGTYTQPTSDVAKNNSWDLTNESASSASIANLTDLAVQGDFYNGSRTAKNMVLNLTDSTVRGVISSSKTAHQNGVTTITAANWYDIGQVDNTAAAAINNGVVVNLAGDSTWKVTGTSYLNSLAVGADAAVVGAGAKAVSMTVDGTPTTITPGTTYTGAIVVTATGADAVASSTSVALAPASTTYGTASAATVTVGADGFPAEGQVTVAVDGASDDTATLDADGTATVALPATLGAGSHQVTASYAGDGGDVQASSGSATLAVAQAASTTEVALAAASVGYGATPVATVDVSYGSHDATGSVTVAVDGTEVDTVALSGGAASVPLPDDLARGGHEVTAVYAGTADVAGSEDGAELTVARGTSTTTATVSNAKPRYGAARSVVVRTTYAGKAAAGAVTVRLDGAKVGTATLAAGRATIPLPRGTTVGRHTVTATYAGDADVTGSSAGAALVVKQATSRTTLSLARTQVARGARLRATVRTSVVGGGPVAATGKVKVYDGSTVVATARLSYGTVTLRLPRLAAGRHRIRAVFVGSADVAASRSAKVAAQVG